MGTEGRLNEEELRGVSGGTTTEFDQRKAEFEAAWDTMGMTQKGFSGMRMAVIFEEWESTEFKTDPKVFLAQYKSV
jgi:hypothetical protein